jgi:tripartite-type tricarboxylate transporter receptor subunit TctC
MFKLALILLSLLVSSNCANAQAFPTPNQPISIIVPYPPGGMGDILARMVGTKMQASLGVPVIVENKPGANGGIGTAYVAHAKPDGHTLAIVPMSAVTINPWLYKDLQYQPKDLTPVVLAISLPNVLLVHPSVPAANLGELIRLAQREPDRLNYASEGNGSSSHLFGELFKTAAGAPMTHVPYKGSGPAMQDLLGGKIQLMFENIANAMPYVKAGKVRALGVGSAAASPQAPDIPTIASVISGFEAMNWIGFVAPAGMPREVLAKLNEHMVRAIRSPEVSKMMEDRGATVVASTPDQFSGVVAADLVRWGKVIKESNITAQ